MANQNKRKISISTIVYILFLSTVIYFVFYHPDLKRKTTPPSLAWQRTFGGTEPDRLATIQKTSDGGYIAAGLTYSRNGDVKKNQGDSDIWIVKFNQQGILEWQKTFGGNGFDSATSIQETSDGGLIIAATGESEEGNACIFKLDSAGNLEWQKTFGGSEIEDSFLIRETSNGEFLTVGSSYSNDGDVAENHGESDIWIIKLDPQGNILWTKSLGGAGSDIASSLLVNSDQEFIIAGYSYSNNADVSGNHGSSDAWIVKMDALGNIQWQKSFGGSDKDFANSIQETSDGGFIVAGNTLSSDGDVSKNQGKSDIWVFKLDPQGNLSWQKTFGGSDEDEAKSIQVTPDGGFVVAGMSRSQDGDVTQNFGDYDYWLLKLDSQGDLEWQKSYGGSGSDEANSLLVTADGGFIIAGESNSKDGDITQNNGDDDFWIIKLDGEET
ncbi:MAG: T9SS C-terminal target domain-containing protein [Deltaproteobacteria bacterium]|nr:T9SS C-terminal target domain-containing protein [Deltaproteobacteria bacterium]